MQIWIEICRWNSRSVRCLQERKPQSRLGFPWNYSCNYIIPMLASGVKPLRIFHQVTEKFKDDAPTRKKISWFCSNYHRTRRQEMTTHGHVREWCANHKIAHNNCGMFVVGHRITADLFAVVLSSEKLLRNAIRYGNNVLMDGTYKLTVLWYPVIVIGTKVPTEAKKFRLIGLGIVRSEDCNSITFVLRQLKAYLCGTQSLQSWMLHLLCITPVLLCLDVRNIWCAISMFAEMWWKSRY